MKESELAESQTIFENQQIDIIFTDSQTQKEVKYKLLNEEKESLLIREDLISNPENFQIKISELFKTESNGQYYLNKDKSKEKYLKNLLTYDKKSEDIKLHNKDENEMKELYREICLKHPRKLVDGEVQKYRFCSWMGCFTCQRISKLEKNEFQQLGLGISSYFKTIKLFIFFFGIISIINLYPVSHYIKYKSVINNSNFFFKTTLGNTKVTTYNSVNYHFGRNDYPLLKLNCQNKTIGKFIYGLEPSSSIDEKNWIFNETEIKFEGNGIRLHRKQIQYYNEKIVKECNLTKECQLTIDNGIYEFYSLVGDITSHNNYLFYECIDMDLIPKNTSQDSLRGITTLTGIITLIILIFLYYYYRKAITVDSEFYHKDKIVINNYTLVLRGLKKSSSSFFQELNDLVSHLNGIISSELQSNPNFFDQDINFFKNDEINNYHEFVRNKNMYIFDISISNVNAEKKSIIEKIKSLKDEITDIKEGHDTLEKKIRHKIATAVESVTSLYNQIKNKNKEDNDEEENNEPLVDNSDDNLNQANQEKIEKTKKKINKQMKKISKKEIGMHIDSFSKKYVDIYITFRNPLISNYIYQNYNKTIFQRILLFFCCRIKTIKLFYYKRQWLNFDLSSNAPTNIIWENCYISGKVKWCRRLFVSFTTIITVIISTILIYIFTDIKKNTNATINSYIITGILKVISIVSSTLLEIFTRCEKNTNLTKNITSDIGKYFVLNYAVSTISVNLRNNYTYQNFESQYPVIMSSILQSMMLSIVTEHLSTLAKFLFNFFKRYLDSDFENGKKTKFKKKNEYEELYTGPEFPIGTRLSCIFVNLGLCLLYGTSCPLIFLFFTLYLLTTFIVDKILIIHYYRKPPYYDNYFTVLTKKILFLSIIVYIYGSVYYISNPYLFNYYQSSSINFGYNGWDGYMILNPFTIIFRIWGNFSRDKISIDKFNLAEISYNFIYLMCVFIVPLLLINLYRLFCKKKREKLSLQNAPNIDIGVVYSTDELNKYYEVKKLELFKFLLNFDDKNSKEFKKYSKLADNYKNVLDYIKQNIDYKKSKIINKEERNENKISEDNNIISTNTNSNEIIIKNKDDLKNDRLLLGDPSFNLAFIPNYEIFAYFDLLYCV